MHDISPLDISTPVVVLDPGDTAHTIARSLGRLGVAVYGVHANPHAAGARSRYWRGNFTHDVSKGDPSAAISWLRDVATRIGDRAVLMPTDDTSALFVADHGEALRDAYRFPAQPEGLARRLSSKKGMYELCKEHGIPTAETRFPQSRGEVEAYARVADYPVMVKGIFTYAAQDHAGIRMAMADDEISLLHWYDRMEIPGSPNVMLQEFIPAGPEDNWMFDGYFDQESHCLLGITAVKLRQYPPYKGRTSLGVCRRNDELMRQIEQLMRIVGYRGVLDIGYRFDARSGEYRLLDVNPRIGMTFRLFVDSSGTDVVRALYRDLTGQPVPQGSAIEGRKWLAEDIDMLSSLRYYRDGNLNLPDWVHSFRRVEETCWLARDDPLPFVAMCGRSLQRALPRRVKHHNNPPPAV